MNGGIYSIIIGIVVIIIGIIKMVVHKFEHNMLYHPNKLDLDYDFQLDNCQENCSLTEHTIYVGDTKINLLYFKNPNTPIHIIYSHGNCGNIANRISFFKKFGKLGSIIIYDYRGFGKSTGIPSEQGLYQDIKGIWSFLVEDNKVLPQNIILYGESLGCAVSAWLAHHLIKSGQLPRSLILQSGFSNLINIAHDMLTFIPHFVFSLILTSKFDNLKIIKKIKNKIPILIAHSHDDGMMNMNHPNMLLRSNPYTQFYQLGGSHNSPEYDDAYLEKIKNLINKQ